MINKLYRNKLKAWLVLLCLTALLSNGGCCVKFLGVRTFLCTKPDGTVASTSVRCCVKPVFSGFGISCIPVDFCRGIGAVDCPDNSPGEIALQCGLPIISSLSPATVCLNP